MDLIIGWLQSGLSGIGPVFILLGLLIFVHELGHFMVAKFFGVRVEVFSLGFGKKIFKTVRGDTTYCISVIPLGGYVKMFGDDPSKEVDPSQKQYSFLDKPVSQRILIVLAGPLMNLFFAAVLFFMIALIGQEVPGPYLGDVKPQQPAYEMGFRSGDQILSIEGEKVKTWKEVQEKVESRANKETTFQVRRAENEELVTVEATPRLKDNENILSVTNQVGGIDGFSPDSLSSLIGVPDPKSRAGQAGLQSLDMIKQINGREIQFFRQIEPQLNEALANGSDSLSLLVQQYDIDSETKEREITLNLSSLNQDSAESVLSQLGIESAELYLLRLKPGGPAETSGLQRGDKILSLNGDAVSKWDKVLNTIKGYELSSGTVEFTVLRSGEIKSFSVAPEMTELMNAQGQEEERFTVGIYPGLTLSYPPMVMVRTDNPIEAVKIGAVKSVEWSGMIVMGIVRMFQGEVSARNVGSLITIGRYASHSFEAGLSQFLRMMAIISINLFLINLLPVPILDGGHLVFFSIEALRGAPLSMRKMEIAQQIGLVILMSVMAFALFNDITNWFAAW